VTAPPSTFASRRRTPLAPGHRQELNPEYLDRINKTIDWLGYNTDLIRAAGRVDLMVRQVADQHAHDDRAAA
jgi:hypothetical protein